MNGRSERWRKVVIVVTLSRNRIGRIRGKVTHSGHSTAALVIKDDLRNQMNTGIYTLGNCLHHSDSIASGLGRTLGTGTGSHFKSRPA